MKTRTKKRIWAGALAQVMAVGTLAATTQLPAGADPWIAGDVVVAVSDGQYQSFTGLGAPEHTINVGQQGREDLGFTTGCAFNPAGFPAVTQNLYTTLWHEKQVAVVTDGAHQVVQPALDTTLSGGDGHPETIVFDTDGNFFVGLVDGTGPNLLKYNKSHTLLQAWTLPLALGMRGVDSIDLDNDLKTIYWTSEDNVIRRFDTSTGTALSDFATLPADRRLYNVRLLQPGNPFGGSGTGVLMVADTTEIKVLNASGQVVNTYGENLAPASGFGNGWFSVSIDGTGTQFLAGDFYGGRVVKFNANDTLAATYSTGRDPFHVNGVCARGEITTGIVPVPDVGFFVVGDVSAGYPFQNPPLAKTVTFHHTGWDDHNSTSLPSNINNSFKGFAENANLSTNPCGGTFTAKGGSAGAAAVSVGQRVAVIVTKQVTDPQGGDVNGQGNVAAIVLVTVTQYSGGGVPVGLGTVSQVICTT